MRSRDALHSGRVELGAVSRKTRGSIGFKSDEVLKRDTPGLSAD